MQLQLEWGDKKFIKIEMKKGRSKKEKSNSWSRVFQIALKNAEGDCKFCLGNFDNSNGTFGERGSAVHTWWGQQTRWKEGEHFW